MGGAATLHWALNFWTRDHLGDKDPNSGNSTHKCPTMRKRLVDERQNEGQCGWSESREMGESSSGWSSEDEGLSKSWYAIGIFSEMESFT